MNDWKPDFDKLKNYKIEESRFEKGFKEIIITRGKENYESSVRSTEETVNYPALK